MVTKGNYIQKNGETEVEQSAVQAYQPLTILKYKQIEYPCQNTMLTFPNKSFNKLQGLDQSHDRIKGSEFVPQLWSLQLIYNQSSFSDKLLTMRFYFIKTLIWMRTNESLKTTNIRLDLKGSQISFLQMLLYAKCIPEYIEYCVQR